MHAFLEFRTSEGNEKQDMLSFSETKYTVLSCDTRSQ